jgi:nitrogen fixation NifU-like protein
MAVSTQLYQEVILDHNKKPRNWGVLADATHRAEGHNPLCGDHLLVTLKLDNDTVGDISFEGESCAICKASASMMTTAEPHHLGRLTVFAGVRDLPTRVKCAILPWHTLHAALNSQQSTTTEAEADPMHAPLGNA